MYCIDTGRLLTAGRRIRSSLTGQEAGTLPGSRYALDGESAPSVAPWPEAAA
jgi:hypothetical protein